MTKLIYAAICSLDGFIEDATGKFDWATPSDEVHQFVNDLQRPVGHYLYGRRMYETMAAWETDPELAASSPVTEDFAKIWQAAEKTVFSRTLQATPTRRTRIERSFDAGAIRDLKARSDRDLSIGGAELAARAFAAGLVDECHLFLAPIAVGAGKPALPRDLRLELELVDERRFADGMVHLRYRTRV
jgi:dihydrofolate reductase